MLTWLLGGYLFLLIFRPYEYWPVLGDFRIERIYMIGFIGAVAFSSQKRFPPSRVNGLVLLFVLAILVSGVFAYRWSSASILIEDYLKFVVFYFIVVLTVRNELEFRWVLLAFIVVMGLYVGKSAWEFFINGRYEYSMGIRRMTGIDNTYGDANSFAASIAYSLPILWALIRARMEQRWVRLGLWAYAALALVAIIYTGSRSGMMTLLFFLMMVLLGTSRKALGIAGLAVLLVVAWYSMPESLQIRFLSIFIKGLAPASADNSAEGRLEGFLHGLEVLRQYPLLGIGPANFQHSWPGIEWGFNAHNLFGQLLGELGSVGALAFGALVGNICLINWRIMRRAKEIGHQAAEAAEAAEAAQAESERARAESRSVAQPAEERPARRRKLWVPRRERALAEAAEAEPGTSESPTAKDVSRLLFFGLVSQGIVQTVLLMLFKGAADHNLYRYTWLWLAALTVLCNDFFKTAVREHDAA